MFSWFFLFYSLDSISTWYKACRSKWWRGMLRPPPLGLVFESSSLLAFWCLESKELWDISTSCMYSLYDSSARSYFWHWPCSCTSWILPSLWLTLTFNPFVEQLSCTQNSFASSSSLELFFGTEQCNDSLFFSVCFIGIVDKIKNSVNPFKHVSLHLTRE